VLPSTTYRVTREDLVRYAGASGDFNVIHWNDRVAREVGLPGVIAHGMLTMALGGRFVGEWWGDPSALNAYSVRFQRPVVVPDDEQGAAVTFGGQVVDVSPDAVTVELTATTSDGDVLGAARAQLRRGADG
jgi:acyl dehydratase